MKKQIIPAVMLTFCAGAVFAVEPMTQRNDDAGLRKYEFVSVDNTGTFTVGNLNGLAGEVSKVSVLDVTKYKASCDANTNERKEITTGIDIEMTPVSDVNSNQAKIRWDFKKLNDMNTYTIGGCEVEKPDFIEEKEEQDINLAINESVTIRGKSVDLKIIRLK